MMKFLLLSLADFFHVTINLNDLTYLIAKHLYFHMVLYVFFLTVVLCQTEILDLFEGNL